MPLLVRKRVLKQDLLFFHQPLKMERHNTDDLFKKMLENPPPMRPDLEALDDMNLRLDAAQPKKRAGVWWWLVPFLFLPFLLSTIFFYFKFQNAQNRLDELNLHLTNQQLNTQIDTLTQTITIYQYDTVFNRVYQDIIIKRNRSEITALLAENGGRFTPSTLPSFGAPDLSANLAKAFNTFDKSSLQPSQLELLKNGKVLSIGQMAVLLEKEDFNSSDSPSSNLNKAKIGWTTKKLAGLDFFNNRFTFEYPLPLSDHFLNLSSKSNVDKINPLWYLVPTGFQAGFNWSPLGIINTINGNNNVKSIGLLGEVEFTRNTRLQFGIDRFGVSIGAESPEEISQFPAGVPTDPSDFLKEVSGSFSYLQVPLTFKYIFQPSKKWKPFFGVGLIARLPLKEQLGYEFISIQGGEYTVNQAINDSGFSINNMRGTIGLEYNFYKNYSIQAEGFYNYQFGTTTNPYIQFRYGGLNLGLKYKF